MQNQRTILSYLWMFGLLCYPAMLWAENGTWGLGLDSLTQNFGFTGHLVVAFLGGLLSSLTPCVYPLIPITLAVCEIDSSMSRARAALYAGTYVFGICVSFTALGLFSARTGNILGAYLGHPLVILVTVVFLIILALHSLEFLNLTIFGQLQSRASRLTAKGLGGVFLTGLLSAFLASPCIGPLLAVVLLKAATYQSAWQGSLLLFCYALGFGLPFFILGTFANLLKKLPRSGSWLEAIKFVIAALVLSVAIYLLATHWTFPAWLEAPYMVGIIALLGIGLIYRSYYQGSKNARLLAALCVAFLLQQTLLSVRTQTSSVESSSEASTDPSRLVWLDSVDQALTQARTQNKIILIDFYADWCLSCQELEKLTFSSPALKEVLSQIVLLRIDVTMPKAEQQPLLKKFGVAGLPLLVFLNPQGQELPNSRIVGFIGPKDLAKHLKNLGAPPQSSGSGALLT